MTVRGIHFQWRKCRAKQRTIKIRNKIGEGSHFLKMYLCAWFCVFFFFFLFFVFTPSHFSVYLVWCLVFFHSALYGDNLRCGCKCFDGPPALDHLIIDHLPFSICSRLLDSLPRPCLQWEAKAQLPNMGFFPLGRYQWCARAEVGGDREGTLQS